MIICTIFPISVVPFLIRIVDQGLYPGCLQDMAKVTNACV